MNSRPSLKQQAAYAKGMQAEQRAIAHLQAQGYVLVASRYKCSAGEIDIIVERDHTLVFVEVKARASTEEALTSLSPHQMRRIMQAAEIFIAEHHAAFGTHDMRCDVITMDKDGTLTHLAHAFDGDY